MVIVEKHLAVKEIYEKWPTLSNRQKIIVREWTIALNPSKKKRINEFFDNIENKKINEAWYNTAMDVIGIFDPTGVVDAVNGVSYLIQGEYLFGFLSFVAAIPYAGDAIAKPMMGALKLSKPGTKAVSEAMKLSKAGKTAEASKVLATASQTGGLAGWFTKQMSGIAPKLKSFVSALPGGPLKGFKNTILEWIELFSKAGKEGLQARRVGQTLAKNLPKMSPAQQVKNLETFQKSLKSIKGPFSGFKGQVGWKYVWGGMPKIFGNRASRALAVKTKWYLGLLDFLGLGNWVGPDELEKQVGEENLQKKIEEYNQTPEAQQNIKDDFGEQPISSPEETSSSELNQVKSSEPETPKSGGSDPITDIFKNMIMGGAGRAALFAL